MMLLKYDRKWWLIPIILLGMVILQGFQPGSRFVSDPREWGWKLETPTVGFLQMVIILGILDLIILRIYGEMANRPFVEITAWWLSVGILSAWFGFVSPGTPQTEFETLARFTSSTVLLLKAGMIFITQL